MLICLPFILDIDNSVYVQLAGPDVCLLDFLFCLFHSIQFNVFNNSRRRHHHHPFASDLFSYFSLLYLFLFVFLSLLFPHYLSRSLSLSFSLSALLSELVESPIYRSQHTYAHTHNPIRIQYTVHHQQNVNFLRSRTLPWH